MNKKEVLALLYKCIAKIDEYLKSNSYDEKLLSSAKIKAIQNGLNSDFMAIRAMDDKEDFSHYEEKFKEIYIDLILDAKEPNIDEFIKAVCNLNYCQRKLKRLEECTLLDNENIAKTLKLITICQTAAMNLSLQDNLSIKDKNTLDYIVYKSNEDFNNIIKGAKVKEIYEEYKVIYDHLKSNHPKAFKTNGIQKVNNVPKSRERKIIDLVQLQNELKKKEANAPKNPKDTKENKRSSQDKYYAEDYKDFGAFDGINYDDYGYEFDDDEYNDEYNLKEQVLKLMLDLKNKIENLLKYNSNLMTDEERNYFNDLLNEISKDFMDAATLNDDDKKVEYLHNKYVKKDREVSDKEEEIQNRHVNHYFDDDDEEDRNNHHHVSRIQKEKDVNEKTKESSKKVRRIVVALALAGSLLGLGACVGSHLTRKNNDNDTKPSSTPEPTPIATIEPTPSPVPTATPAPEVLLAQNINFEDYDELLDYSCKIQDKLPEGSDLTIDDIMNTLKIANWDKLKDTELFVDHKNICREDICAATYYMGRLAPIVGVDALVQRSETDDIYMNETQMKDIIMTSTDNFLSLENFADAKTEKGYDLYKVLEICLHEMYQVPIKPEENNIVIGENAEHPIPNPTQTTKPEDDPEYVPFNYAKVMNEITAREALDFTVCPNSPLSTHYVVAGMYTANQEQILYLTSRKNLGPIYGYGPRIDGSHGYICVEELARMMYIDAKGGTFIGNEDNAIYSFLIDDRIIKNAQAR